MVYAICFSFMLLMPRYALTLKKKKKKKNRPIKFVIPVVLDMTGYWYKMQTFL